MDNSIVCIMLLDEWLGNQKGSVLRLGRKQATILIERHNAKEITIEQYNKIINGMTVEEPESHDNGAQTTDNQNDEQKTDMDTKAPDAPPKNKQVTAPARKKRA